MRKWGNGETRKCGNGSGPDISPYPRFLIPSHPYDPREPQTLHQRVRLLIDHPRAGAHPPIKAQQRRHIDRRPAPGPQQPLPHERQVVVPLPRAVGEVEVGADAVNELMVDG